MDDQDKLNEFLGEAVVGRPTTIELVKGLTEGKERVDVTLRRAVEEPVRAESPARSHVFWSIGGFAKYIAKYGGADTVILGDPETGRISGVLDDTAGRGFEIVTFEAKMDPRWQAWKTVIGKSMLVRDFAKFVVTQKPVIVEPAGEILAQLFTQIRMSKKVELQNGFGDDSTNGVMIDVEIRGQAPDKQPVKLPKYLVVECPMFLGREPVSVSVDIILDSKGNDVVVELYSGEADTVRLREIEKMLAEVQEQVTNGFVSLGCVGHSDWKYVNSKD